MLGEHTRPTNRTMEPTILIKIASYRDRELPKTIQSALTNAVHPENLRFAVYNQEDVHVIDDLQAWRKDPRFRITDIPWRSATGPALPRHTNDTKWDGEDVTLQIDSHMRFGDRWDERLINEWVSRDNDHAVLSLYPPDFSYRQGREVYESTYVPRRLVVKHVVEDSVTLLGLFNQKVPTDRPHLLASGGFMFSHGALCQAVTTNPKANYGEELTHSLQLFQNGYHIYTPRDLPVWHWYGRTGKANRISTDFNKGSLKDSLDRVTEQTRNACNEIVFGPDPENAKRPTRIFMKKLKLAYMDMPWPKDWPNPDNWDEEAAALWENLKTR